MTLKIYFIFYYLSINLIIFITAFFQFKTIFDLQTGQQDFTLTHSAIHSQWNTCLQLNSRIYSYS